MLLREGKWGKGRLADMARFAGGQDYELRYQPKKPQAETAVKKT